MNNNTREFFDFLGAVIHVLGMIMLVCIAIVGVSIAIGYPLMSYECKRLGVNTEKTTEYHFLGGGCLIETDEGLVPVDRWIYNTGN